MRFFDCNVTSGSIYHERDCGNITICRLLATDAFIFISFPPPAHPQYTPTQRKVHSLSETIASCTSQIRILIIEVTREFVSLFARFHASLPNIPMNRPRLIKSHSRFHCFRSTNCPHFLIEITVTASSALLFRIFLAHFGV